jgi:hypothetical protein
VEKALLIPHTHVVQSTFEGEINDGVWMVWSQQNSNVIYKVWAPFIAYACCVYEWALCNNLCKHQIIVLLTCTYLTKGNIIEYCGTWFRTNCGGFKTMFMDPTYLQLDDGSLKIKIMTRIWVRMPMSLKLVNS